MSSFRLQKWLLSHNIYEKQKKLNAKTVAICSGKGGVGKTSIAIRMARDMAKIGMKILLIDCDYNLSNVPIKLGFNLNNNLVKWLEGEKTFEDCLNQVFPNFFFLAGGSGSSELFGNDQYCIKKTLEIIKEKIEEFNLILLDIPAGISESSLFIASSCDYRFIITNPDSSSIINTYALIKVLNQKMHVMENHLLVNNILTSQQLHQTIIIIQDVVTRFLTCQLQVVGGISRINESDITKLDEKFIHANNSPVVTDFRKLIKYMAEECLNDFYPSFSSLSKECSSCHR